MVELLGNDRFVWASDYPHVDAQLASRASCGSGSRGCPRRASGKILGDNAGHLYGLA